MNIKKRLISIIITTSLCGNFLSIELFAQNRSENPSNRFPFSNKEIQQSVDKVTTNVGSSQPIPALSESDISAKIKEIKTATDRMKRAKGLLIADFVAKATVAAVPLLSLILSAAIGFGALTFVSGGSSTAVFSAVFLSLVPAFLAGAGTGTAVGLNVDKIEEMWINLCNIIAISALRKNALSYFLLLPTTHLAVTRLKYVRKATTLANELKNQSLTKQQQAIINGFNTILSDVTINGLLSGVRKVEVFDNYAQAILNQHPQLVKQLGKKGLKNTRKWLWTNWELSNFQNAYNAAENAGKQRWEKKKQAAFAKGKILKDPKNFMFKGKIKYSIKIKSREKIINSLNKKYPAFKELGKEVITDFVNKIKAGSLKGKAR